MREEIHPGRSVLTRTSVLFFALFSPLFSCPVRYVTSPEKRADPGRKCFCNKCLQFRLPLVKLIGKYWTCGSFLDDSTFSVLGVGLEKSCTRFATQNSRPSRGRDVETA